MMWPFVPGLSDYFFYTHFKIFVKSLAPKIFLGSLEDFLKNLAQKRVGMRPPSGSAPAYEEVLRTSLI